MYLSTIIASIAALGMGVIAAPAPAAYTRYAQVRLYGEPGCSAQNLGELGVYDINQCKMFGDSDVIRSVSFEFNTPGCTCKLLHCPIPFRHGRVLIEFSARLQRYYVPS
jgi:hypothetical protein